MRGVISYSNLKRRDMLRMGVGVAGGLAMPALASISVCAAVESQHAPVGTWPAGVAGDSIFVGVTVPLTGPYSASGKDLALGYELALGEINGGDPIAQKQGLKGKGVLGKQIRYRIADSETKPNVAVEEQTRFITSDRAILITGGVASSTSIALEELAQREKVLYMVGESASIDTTGKDCQRYGFRPEASGYMMSRALVPVLAKEIGKDLKVAYLVPDYTWGHTMFNSMSTAGKTYGWAVATEQVVPLGTTDFSAALLNIAGSGGNLLVNLTFGNDALTSIKQAAQFGVSRKMKLAVPSLSEFLAEEVGGGLMAGAYGCVGFWWELENRYPLAKDFVPAFYAKNGYYPRWGANIGYMQTYIWAQAVERAKTFYPPAVIKVLEASKSQPFDSTVGKVWYRAEDHQLVRPLLVLRGKAPAAMKNSEDFYEVVEILPGEELVPPPGMFGCHLGPYT